MRYNGLDGLRGLAVTAVVWHHATPTASDMTFTHRGYLGVDLFFALSGFLITAILAREHTTQPVNLKHFYARRALRIFPAYYATLGFAALFASTAAANLTDRPWVYVAYLSNWFDGLGILAFTWSLAAEEQFYLAWPVVYARFNRWAEPVAWAALAANIVWQWSGVTASEMGDVTFVPVIAGVLLAVRSPEWVKHPKGFLVAATVTGTLIAAAPVMVGPWRTATQLGLAAVVATAAHRPPGLLDNRVLARLGTVSYGVYLSHMFVRHAAVGVAGETLWLFPLMLCGSWVAAEVSFRTIEAPFMALKSGLSPSRSG